VKLHYNPLIFDDVTLTDKIIFYVGSFLWPTAYIKKEPSR